MTTIYDKIDRAFDIKLYIHYPFPMGKSKQVNSLCHILRKTDSSESDGIGVFIGPSTVLTAEHVIHDSQSLTITNTKGQTTSNISDIFTAEGVDAAVVVLEEPIGRSVCSVAKPQSISGKDIPSAKLITFFNGNQMQHPVSLCPTFDSSAGTARFYAKCAVQPGYSGSPILDHRGRIISLATDIYSMEEGSPRKTTEGKSPFFAVQPKALLGFLYDLKEKNTNQIKLDF